MIIKTITTRRGATDLTYTLSGTFTNYTEAISLTTSGDYEATTGVSLKTGDTFTVLASDETSYGLAANTRYLGNQALGLTASGSSISITRTDTYDIYFDAANSQIYVMNSGYTPGQTVPLWGVIGTHNSWSEAGDDNMEELDDDLWVCYDITITATEEFKFLYNHDTDWTDADQIGFEAGTVAVDEPIYVKHSGSNIASPGAGTFDFYLDLTNMVAYVMTSGKTPADAGELDPDRGANVDVPWYISADSNSWSTTANPMSEVDGHDGWWYASYTFSAWDNFQFEYNNWSNQLGFTTWAAISTDTTVSLPGSANIGVENAGTYDVYLNPTDKTCWLTTTGTTPW